MFTIIASIHTHSSSRKLAFMSENKCEKIVNLAKSLEGKKIDYENLSKISDKTFNFIVYLVMRNNICIVSCSRFQFALLCVFFSLVTLCTVCYYLISTTCSHFRLYCDVIFSSNINSCQFSCLLSRHKRKPLFAHKKMSSFVSFHCVY